MEKGFLLKGIHVIDPGCRTTQQRDVYIHQGVYGEGDAGVEYEMLPMEDCYLAPGLMDMHTHIFAGRTLLGIHADKVGIRQGVSTVVDAGSTGIRDFDCFQKEVIETVKTDVKFFLNIARQGLCDGLSELADSGDLMTVEELQNFKKVHGKDLVGLKVRMSSSVVKNSGIRPLIHARTLSDEAGLPLMVHIGNGPPELFQVLDLLKKGDIVTHCFHGKKGGMCDNKEAYRKAVDRGVHFDVGHGTSSFSYEMMPKVLAVKAIDYSISTDIYKTNFEKPVGSLMQTMTKFLEAGVPLEELIYKVTDLPRAVLGLPKERLLPGEIANGTVFRVMPKPEHIILTDAKGVNIPAKKVIAPVMTIKQGRRIWEGDV